MESRVINWTIWILVRRYLLLLKFLCPAEKYLVFLFKWSPFSYQFSYLRYKWWHCSYLLSDRLQEPTIDRLSDRLWHIDSRLSRGQHRLNYNCNSKDIPTSSNHPGCVHCGPLNCFINCGYSWGDKCDASELQQPSPFELRLQDYCHNAISVQPGHY
jgi:hypothetical protein